MITHLFNNPLPYQDSSIICFLLHISYFTAAVQDLSLIHIFGGKGINVSSMLAQLGMKSTALGFIAGFTGEALEQGVAAMGIQPDFLRVEQGFTRINVKVHAQEESEINGQGPLIRTSHIEQLVKKLDRLKKDDILVLSGNVPASIPQDIYADIMQHLQGSGIRICVEARQESLMSTLVYHPFLIKPNHKELAEMFEVELSSREDLPVSYTHLDVYKRQIPRFW